MQPSQGTRSKRTLLLLGLASALAACEGSSGSVADGGVGGAGGGLAGACRLPWGSDMPPAATCADTFDTQTTSHPPLIKNNEHVASGACGGYLVWLNTGMLYSLACIYDPATKMLVGGRYAGDTGGACTGVGTALPSACLTEAPYPVPDAGS